MDLSGSWECPICNKFNDYEGNIKDIYFSGIKTKCDRCGTTVVLKGYVSMEIEADLSKDQM